MKLFAILLLLTSTALLAQAPATAPDEPPQDSTFSVRSSIVLVPTMVKTKKGDVVFTLTADDFIITDDGVPQKLRLEEDTDSQPLALVIVAEVGGSGVDHLDQYRDLGPILDAVVGGVPHKVAVVGFDSRPILQQDFTPDVNVAAKVLGDLDQGDNRAATIDAISFAVDLLRKQPTTYRRAILLLSETLDNGSHTKIDDALRAISDTNTAIYSIGFSSSKSQISHEGGNQSSDDPGPAHGCFSRNPDDPNVDLTQSRKAQDYDCLETLLPPLRIATIAAILAKNSLKKNVPETVAHLTGGEYFGFKNVKTLQHDLLIISNRVPNRYVLSFVPTSTHPGFHAIDVKLKDRPNLKIEARTAYWVDDTSVPKR
jgi:VWFA-related protein